MQSIVSFLEALRANSSEILPVNCKFICVCTFLFCVES